MAGSTARAVKEMPRETAQEWAGARADPENAGTVQARARGVAAKAAAREAERPDNKFLI